MKKLLLVFIFGFSTFNHNTIWAQNYSWTKSFGGATTERGGCVELDQFNNVYMSGSFNGTVDFDPGPNINNLTSNGNSDVFIEKLDSAGNFIWAVSFGGSSFDEAISMTIDPYGNILITGYFSGVVVDFDPGPGQFPLVCIGNEDAFILKLDPQGNFMRACSFGYNLDDYGCSISTDPAGNIFVTGMFYGTQVDFDPGPNGYPLTSLGRDIFILKLDNSFNFKWAKRMGNSANDYGKALVADLSGNVYTIGSYTGNVDFNPGAGTSYLNAGAGVAIFVQKLDSLGNFVWAKSLGTSLVDNGSSITLSKDNNLVFAGTFQGSSDFDPGLGTNTLTSHGGADILIEKMDTAGNHIWAGSIGGIEDDACNYITTDLLGNIYLTGYFRSTTDFDPGLGVMNITTMGGWDAFVLKLDSSGNYQWSGGMGSIDYETGNTVKVSKWGEVYTIGQYRNTVDFNPGVGVDNLTSLGGHDVFIQKLVQTNLSVNMELKNNSIKLYPNPNNGSLTVDLGKVKKNISLEIYSLTGQLFFKETFDGEQFIHLDTEKYSEGLYLLKLDTEPFQTISFSIIK